MWQHMWGQAAESLKCSMSMRWCAIDQQWHSFRHRAPLSGRPPPVVPPPQPPPPGSRGAGRGGFCARRPFLTLSGPPARPCAPVVCREGSVSAKGRCARFSRCQTSQKARVNRVMGSKHPPRTNAAHGGLSPQRACR